MEMIRHALALAIGVIILSIPLHAASVLVWFLVNNAIPDVLVCKAEAGQVGWRVERAKRRTFDLWDLLPWRFYNPLMRDLYIAYYLSVGYSEGFPCFPGSSRIYIHSAPFPTYAFSGIHNIKRVTIRLPRMGGPMRPFHYTVFIDRQASQDGFQVPDDILRNHNFGNGYERLYGNIVAVKNQCLPLSDGILRPYEEAVRVITATMEDTGIIKDVLEVLVEDHTIGLLAIPADAIWVEVNPLGSTPAFHFEGLPPSPRLQPDPPHFSDPSDGGQDDEPASNTHMPPASSNSLGGLGGASSTGQRGGHFPDRSTKAWTRRASSLGVPEESSRTGTGQRGARGRFPNPPTWTRRASSLGVLEESSRGGRRGGRSFSRARQASSSRFGGRGRGDTLLSSSYRGRSVRIQVPGDLTQVQAGREQSAQLPSESGHPHAPGSQLDVSPIDLDAGEENNLESGATRSSRAAASFLWTVSPAPSPPSSDDGDGEIEYLSA